MGRAFRLFAPHLVSDRAARKGARIAGVDEAGRGPLAGPVVAAAVILCDPVPDGIGDSKALAPARRAELDRAIRRDCVFGVGLADVAEIDALNIFHATMLAMSRAVEALCRRSGADPSDCMIDGNLTPAGRCNSWRWPARAIVGGDASEPAIGAASILAKEHRDRLMRDASARWPAYGWERNKGYATAEHRAALERYGPSPLHRRSFAPVARSADLFGWPAGRDWPPRTACAPPT